MISREPIQYDDPVTITSNVACAPQHDAPPKLEKLQKLAQLTGLPAITGSPAPV